MIRGNARLCFHGEGVTTIAAAPRCCRAHRPERSPSAFLSLPKSHVQVRACAHRGWTITTRSGRSADPMLPQALLTERYLAYVLLT